MTGGRSLADDARFALRELAFALERQGFRVRHRGRAVVDFPFVRVVAGPARLPALTLGNFSPEVALRLAAALNSAACSAAWPDANRRPSD